MNRKEFLETMAMLEAGSATSKPMTELQAEVYFDILKDLPAENVRRAARQALIEGQYPTIPPVGVLRRLAGAGAVETESRALVAYGAAARAVQSAGGYRSVDFDDQLVNAVIRDLGGWERFCDWPLGEIQWRKRDFIRQYEALESVGISVELAAPLAGIIATENSAGGYVEHVPGPEKICCGLPAQRPNLVSGEDRNREKRLGARSGAGRAQRIVDATAGAMKAVVSPDPAEHPISDQGAEKLQSFQARVKAAQREPPQMTDAEFRARKAEVLAELKQRATAELA